MLGFGLSTAQNGGNNFRFQKQERVFDYGLNWDLFKFRYSDSQIGRFHQTDPLSADFPYNSTYALQENKFGRGIELEGKELFPWVNVIISQKPVVARPVIEPVTETIVGTQGGRPQWNSNLTPKENITNLRRIGNEAHAERQADWAKEGFQTEKYVSKSDRVDGIKIEKAGTEKTGTIRELKPDTKTGKEAGYKQLERYVEAAIQKYPDVKNWKPELELYRTSKPVVSDATKVDNSKKPMLNMNCTNCL